MATSRIAPAQLLTDLPLQAAREATWQGLREAGVKDPLIDAAQNLVTGTTGDGFIAGARAVRATFERQAGGTLISVLSQPIMGGVIESGGAKTKKAAKIVDAVEAVIGRGWTRIPTSQSPFASGAPSAPVGEANSAGQAPNVSAGEANFAEQTPSAPSGEAPFAASNPPLAAPGAPYAAASAPIAAPGAPVAPSGDPVYGGALPPKQGTTLLIYGILGLLCCQILAPFTIYYSTKALQNYGDVDPGDKNLVKVARVLGIIGTIFMIVRIVGFAANIGRGPGGY